MSETIAWRNLDEAWQHLRQNGWTRNRMGEWVRPTRDHEVTELEQSAVDYLQEHADAGPIAT